MNENREVPIGVGESPRERQHIEDSVHRTVVRAEKTFAGVERLGNHLAEMIQQQTAVPGVAKAPCPQFKEWTSNSNS